MLDKDRLGAALWARVKLESGGYTPGIGPVQDAQGLQLWKGIADEIILEFTANAIVPVQPGTFKDSTNTPITGAGVGAIT